jgi:hypothetical protein
MAHGIHGWPKWITCKVWCYCMNRMASRVAMLCVTCLCGSYVGMVKPKGKGVEQVTRGDWC